MAVFFILSSVHASAETKNVIVSKAWMRQVPPSQKITAAYMTIENNSDREVVLATASADVAEAVEIHQMKSRDGMMTMEMMKDLPVPARTKVALEPSGIHLMMIGLKNPVQAGDVVAIKLGFSGGDSVVVDTEVRDE